jgi:hypothetical protein
MVPGKRLQLDIAQTVGKDAPEQSFSDPYCLLPLSSRRALAQERGTPAIPSDLAPHSRDHSPLAPLAELPIPHDARVASVRVESQLGVTLKEGAVACVVAGLGIAASGLPGTEIESGRSATCCRTGTS